MLTKKQLTLLQPFQRNIFKEYSFRELATLATEKSHNALQLALKQFMKEKLITERKIGTSKLYKLRSENESVYDHLTLIKYKGLPFQVVYCIESLKKEIEKYTTFYSLILFGSYATGQQTKGSDLDVTILLPDKTQEKNIKVAVNMTRMTSSTLPLHAQVITFDDFIEMLVNKEKNVGKEIAHKHRAVHNINIFYKCVKRALEHGFRY